MIRLTTSQSLYLYPFNLFFWDEIQSQDNKIQDRLLRGLAFPVSLSMIFCQIFAGGTKTIQKEVLGHAAHALRIKPYLAVLAVVHLAWSIILGIGGPANAEFECFPRLKRLKRSDYGAAQSMLG